MKILHFCGFIFFFAVLISCERRDFEAQPAVETGQVTAVHAKSAVVEGTIIDLGLGVEDHGHCWNRSPQPTVKNEYRSFGKISELKIYTCELEDLEPGVTYFVRAFVASKEDTYYGEEVSFTTLSGHAEVSTSEVIDISLFTAKCGGNVISGGGDEVAERGVCWDTTELFGLSHSLGFTADSLGMGSFESELSGLIPEKEYYVKSYAITSIDTTYGKIKSFSTLGGLETIVTTDAKDITAIAATCGGAIGEAWGKTTIIAKGVCWSTSQNPSIEDQKTNNGPGTGSFSGSLTGLNPGVTYFVRAYATSSIGTYYGPQQSFTTLDGSVTLTTAPVSEITTISATSGGNISDDGGAPITARGVCWSTSQNPTIDDQRTSNGSGTGSFSSSLSGLSPNTTYYVKAYATNKEGTSYGSQQNFTTLTGSVILTTSSISGITTTSAISGGIITDDGGAAISARGVCWNTSHNPTIYDYKATNGAGTGGFVSSITGLDPGTIYYVRAYATNSVGTEYGNERSFTTEGLVDYDGNIYLTVQIGSQIWMTENLKTTHYANGSAIPYVESNSEWGNLGYSDKAFCWYDNSAFNRDIYGGLYTWASAMNGAGSSNSNPSYVQGVCPDGWHLPSDNEWKQLEMHLGMTQSEADIEGWRGTDEGGKLKEAGTSHWISPNNGATNSSGFSALPGGHRYYDGSFRRIGSGAGFWTATEQNSSLGWRRHLHSYDTGIDRDGYEKNIGRSVRCIKD